MELKEVELTDGTIIRCADVPPMATRGVVSQFPECKLPSAPIEEIKNVDGTVDRVAARHGTPQYDEWNKQLAAVNEAIERVETEAMFVLGIVDWKLPGQKTFTDEVPKSWEIPSHLLKRGGIKPHGGPSGRVWDYVVYGLVKTIDDMNTVLKAVGGISELTTEEVEAVADKFPGDKVEAASTADS